MNLKFNFLAVSIFILTSFVTSNAQFKKVIFDPKAKVNKEDINITLKKEGNETESRKSVSFSTIDVSAVSALKSGLKPGVINERKVPAYIEGTLTNAGSRGGTTENLVFEYLDAAASMMKIEAPSEEFVISRTETDALHMTHVRLQQHVKGVPVYGAEVIIHGESNRFNFLNGTYFPTIKMESVLPSLKTEEAVHVTVTDLGEMINYDHEIKAAGDMTPVTNLVIYPYEGTHILAYHITAYKNLIERWEYFINANTGVLIHKYQSICKFHHHHTNGEKCPDGATVTNAEELKLLDGKSTANAVDLFNINRLINTYEISNQNKYFLIDGSRDMFSSAPSKLPDDPEGVIWTIDAFNTSPSKSNFNYDHVTSVNNIWNNKTAVSAHYNGGKAYEYYRNTHNRKSINGSGGNIVSLINVADDDGSSMGNAFWNGQAMFYGNGDNAFQPLAKGLDVAGHEMTHGVVQSTANLEYEGESGALNESFADVFGAMIDRDDWKIGEDVVKTSAFPSGALRSLEDPHNGAAFKDFNKGWQPRLVSEKYIGTEDNGGVHINSGIPNFAFFKFATAIGKDKAEKVYYRALTNYLTKSSQFVDCRIAVIKAATDLYGATEANAAAKAFDEVGIVGSQGGNYETDLDTNPGQEFILTTSSNNTGLFLYDTNGNNLGTISNSGVLSKPSISDDGKEIVFIGTDEKMHYIFIDWSKSPVTPQEQIIENNPVWRNAIISKDGFKIAALTKEKVNEIIVFYFGSAGTVDNTFELYNPTYSNGVTTGDVNFADAMEFDATGEYIVYDAENEIKSSTAGSISYWDISFIKVWNNSSKTFSLGKIEKLFTSLPENVSVGNPTFSKNSPYIIAFDYIDENGDVTILGSNTETGEVKSIYENGNNLGYPNYSSKDNKLLFDTEGSFFSYNVGIVNLKTNKIEPSANPTVFIAGKRWAVWFSNGNRVLSETDNTDLKETAIASLVNNPTSQSLDLIIHQELKGNVGLEILNGMGQQVSSFSKISAASGRINLDVSGLPSGTYFLSIVLDTTRETLKFIKQQ